MPDGPTYSDEEAEAIFRRAFERQAAEDGFEHDDLVQAARELGLDESAISRAMQDLARDRAEQSVVEAVRARQRAAWQRHLVAFLVLVGGALALSAAGVLGTWPIVMALLWGTLMAVHTFDVVRGPGERALARERRDRARAAKREAQLRERERAREEARRQREAEREAKRAPKRAARELERVVDEGVALLLKATADKLEGARKKAEAPPPDTEFNRFVAKKKAEARGESPAPRAAPKERAAPRREAPRVRVDVPDEPDHDEERVEEAAAKRRGRRRR